MLAIEDIALAVVARKGLVLVQKRYRKECGLLYEFPGGSRNIDESWCEAATRELLEETGLVESECYEYVVKPSVGGGQISFVVFVSSTKQEPAVVNENRRQTYHWFEPRSIPLDDFHAPDVEFIEHDLSAILSTIVS